ncbi:MAG: hypothetical protein GXP49_16340 [Deltaproteobacteria bacterium]|nr:hypothetical protein [Deltaproteobacteria bacterium]
MRTKYYLLFSTVLAMVVAVPTGSMAHKINSKKGVYFVTPILTEKSWIETEAWLKLDMRDRDEPSRPNPAVGFYPDLGLEVGVFNLFSVKTHMPMWVNNWTEKKDQDIDDFFIPNWYIGGKVDISAILDEALGDSSPKWLSLAASYDVGIPTGFGLHGINKTASGAWADKADLVHQAKLLGGVSFYKFSIQADVGINYWQIDDRSFLNNTSSGTAGVVTPYKNRTDIVYDIALPYYFRYESTVLMVELNGLSAYVENQSGTKKETKNQLFITPGVTFAPGSNFTLGFGFAIPLVDDFYNDNFRFIMNFRYAFSVPGVSTAFWHKKEEKEGEKKQEKKEVKKPSVEKKTQPKAEEKPAEPVKQEKKEKEQPASKAGESKAKPATPEASSKPKAEKKEEAPAVQEQKQGEKVQKKEEKKAKPEPKKQEKKQEKKAKPEPKKQEKKQEKKAKPEPKKQEKKQEKKAKPEPKKQEKKEKK